MMVHLKETVFSSKSYREINKGAMDPKTSQRILNSENKKESKRIVHLTLLRHGQSTSNISGINSPHALLTADGVKQCREYHKTVASKCDLKTTEIWVSPLVRAMQTAAICFFEIEHYKMVVEPLLKECEGYPSQPDQVAVPEESYEAVTKRILDLFRKIHDCKSNHLLFVTHSMLSRRISAMILNQTDLNKVKFLTNCGQRTFEIQFPSKKKNHDCSKVLENGKKEVIP